MYINSLVDRIALLKGLFFLCNIGSLSAIEQTPLRHSDLSIEGFKVPLIYYLLGPLIAHLAKKNTI
jgi:hypothetical protein